MADKTDSVQSILHDSLVVTDSYKMMRREGSTLSVSSLPATMLSPKPFFISKIPIPKRDGSTCSLSGRSTPNSGSRRDLSSPAAFRSMGPPVPPKPKLATPTFRKVPLRREISSPPSLENRNISRRGSVDSVRSVGGGTRSASVTSATPPSRGAGSKIPQWQGSVEKLNVAGFIRKWESSGSLEVSVQTFKE
jgi:hypothetical protein